MLKTSYGEQLCRGVLKRWFPERNVLYNYRPIWLKNPETGRNLELDIYYPDLNLAVEFNGIQHKLLLQRRKDYFKAKKCSELGILMLSVYHPLDLYKCKTRVKRHTGFKTVSGRKDEKFLWEVKAYSIGDTSTDWYIQSKLESEQVANERDEVKKVRRLKKIEKRREAKRIARLGLFIINNL